MNDVDRWRAELPFAIAHYGCPLIDPPAQRHLFENKIHNIRLAISRMHPCVLQPRAGFSFWDQALEPSVANGYREGAMFLNHRVSTSIGGGLCQLSGLIYNLALLSGCRILERFNHSIDAYGEERYIPLGRDATVAYGRKDLRFANPHDFAIAFELAVDAKRAWGTVWAARAVDGAIDIETRLVRTIESPILRVADDTLASGQEIVEPGLSGKVVTAWMKIERAGRPTEIRPLSRDRYLATATIVRRRAIGALDRVRNLIAGLAVHGQKILSRHH